MNPELAAQRLGKLTASDAAKIMGDLKTSGLATLVKRLAWERVYGDTGEDSYKSPAMLRGNVVESEALDWYEFATDREFLRGVHLTHPRLSFVGATPDGLADDRVIEAKSVLHSAFMDVKRERAVPSQYRWQCRWQMWNASLFDCDFFVYNPTPKPPGIIVPFHLKQSEADEMEERAHEVDRMVREWVSILCRE